VRARDLRANILEYGAEKGITMTLEHLLEEWSATRVQLREMADLVSQLVNTFDATMRIATGMQRNVDELRRIIKQGDDADGPTR